MENQLLWNSVSQMSTNTRKLPSNLEEGLLRPANKDVFLTSSIAFLHQQLLKKIESEVQMKEFEAEKKYSDLLIVTTHSDQSRTIYVQLKDVSKFDEAMRNECTFPSKKLSIEQLLPKPGSVKLPSKRKSRLSLFTKKSVCNVSTSTTSKITFNFWKMFRKSSKEIDTAPSVYNTQSKMEIVIKFLQSIPNEPYMLTPASSEEQTKKRLEMSDLSLPIIIQTKPSNVSCVRRAPEARSRRHYLTKDEQEVLRRLPRNPRKPHVSKSETFRTMKPDFVESTPSICCSKCRMCENSSTNNNNNNNNQQRRQGSNLKKALSKISVCLDEDDDYEKDSMLTVNASNSSGVCCGDESSFMTPEVLKDIIRRFVEELQNS